ncbi:amino acid ABC transporter permease [Boudabousia liubingyangii]|uniref:amino acid ABC transporter permease n=1 Tax=Boudabousia liubingyangii TaxID=1921764 RepID=UPI00093BB189|nr:amino acid ABC transporter permease [Boudabousia liubingyangii]OKL46340.1 amino acid ABC transporter permease [Boudabousia liubingyangii]
MMLSNPMFYQGLLIVFEVFTITLVASLPLGLLIALARLSRLAPLRWLAQVYITVLRGTPLLLQMTFIYFGLPAVGLVFDRMPAVYIAFVLNYAAYFAEIYRGGLESIPKGQFEAARTLGFSTATTYRRIILPQVVKRVLPPISNEVITLVKDTSLVYALGVNDILRVTQIEMNKTASLMPLLYSAGAYLILVIALTYILQRLEKRLAYYA